MQIKKLKYWFPGILFFVSVVVLCIEWRGTVGKYKPGMSLDEVRELSGYGKELNNYALDYLDPPTEFQKRNDAVSYFVDNNGVLLSFNAYEELIVIERVKYFGINPWKIVDFFR